MAEVEFADKVARCCVFHYEKVLEKKGKPRHDVEWTPMAAVVCHDRGE